jgi:hypothetical protein
MRMSCQSGGSSSRRCDVLHAILVTSMKFGPSVGSSLFTDERSRVGSGSTRPEGHPNQRTL